MDSLEHQKKNTRLDLRLTAESKMRLQKAATLAGLDLTAFTLAAALEKADALLNENERRILSQQQAEHFLSLLDTQEPTEKLVSAIQRYRLLDHE
jgi:uncharacterized protein (DUF1778 family)